MYWRLYKITRLRESCFLRSHACILPSSFPGGSPKPMLSQLTHLCWFEYGVAQEFSKRFFSKKDSFVQRTEVYFTIKVKNAFLSFFQTMWLLPKVLWTIKLKNLKNGSVSLEHKLLTIYEWWMVRESSPYKMVRDASVTNVSLMWHI